jgi:hypothetical protein
MLHHRCCVCCMLSWRCAVGRALCCSAPTARHMRVVCLQLSSLGCCLLLLCALRPAATVPVLCMRSVVCCVQWSSAGSCSMCSRRCTGTQPPFRSAASLIDLTLLRLAVQWRSSSINASALLRVTQPAPCGMHAAANVDRTCVEGCSALAVIVGVTMLRSKLMQA